MYFSFKKKKSWFAKQFRDQIKDLHLEYLYMKKIPQFSVDYKSYFIFFWKIKFFFDYYLEWKKTNATHRFGFYFPETSPESSPETKGALFILTIYSRQTSPH